MPYSSDELYVMIQQLNQRIVQLPSVTQIDNLLASVEDYKNTQNSRIAALESSLETVRAELEDLKARVQALEDA